jgi:hypothetical protein
MVQDYHALYERLCAQRAAGARALPSQLPARVR